jgi:hypothetical protein
VRGQAQPIDAFGAGGTCAQNGGIAGLNYRNQAFWNADWNRRPHLERGGHAGQRANSLKLATRAPTTRTTARRKAAPTTSPYRFNNGIPNQLTQRLEAYRTYSRVRYNAFYVQDQITRGRLTMTGALRYDHSWSYYPEQSIGGPGVRFLPNQVHVGRVEGRDRLQRHHAACRCAYDVFGNGKTAVKFNVGKYLEAAVNGNGNYSALLPELAHRPHAERTWTDANGNYSPIAIC